MKTFYLVLLVACILSLGRAQEDFSLFKPRFLESHDLSQNNLEEEVSSESAVEPKQDLKADPEKDDSEKTMSEEKEPEELVKPVTDVSN